MFRTVSVLAALVVGLCVASARAQTPFGGDDTGFIPPAADAKCEAGAGKAADKLIACILKCHASRASGKLADDTAEDSCEKTLVGKSCTAKFAGSIAKLKGCPACINGTTMANVAGVLEATIDGMNSTVYCDTSSGTPFGGDDTGDIPTAKSTSAKCEAGAAKAAGKLIACIDKCHASRASGKLADDTAEDSCETTLVGKSCTAKFAGSIAKLSSCPSCINGTTMGNLAGTIESLLDGANSTIYCGGAPSCTMTTFNFSVNSSGGGPGTDSSWDDGSMTQPSATAPCNVTVKAPSGDITLVGTLGDAWTVTGFTGFSSCVLTGGCNANGGTCTSCNGVDAPSSCPPLGIPNCTDNRPSCSVGLNGNASDSAHVTCSPAAPSTTSTSSTTTSSTTTTPPTTLACGAVVGGFCWYKGAIGQNCDATCAAAGRVYDVATRDYAGSNGTNQNCTDVATALGPVSSDAISAGSDGGYGCIDGDSNGSGFLLRITTPETTSAATPSAQYRYCACQ